VKIKIHTTTSDVPSPFVTQHTPDVTGVLSGFDRLRLMATLRPLYQPSLTSHGGSGEGIILWDEFPESFYFAAPPPRLTGDRAISTA
jgi:hypothetical protein